MSSTEPHHTPEGTDSVPTESEPLLGRPGDATQKPDAPMWKNLILGTGWVAQVGLTILVALVWTSVFTNKLVPLFSPHPLLQTAGVYFLGQAILVLQPTNSSETKRRGARVHATLNLLSFLLFVAGFTIIEVNKVVNGNPHFHSVHAYFGFITSVVLILQYTIGFFMWAVPAVFGGEANAKAIWKYHRMNGYVLLPLLLITVVSATQTDYNLNVLDVKLWATLVATGLIIAGIYPRIQLTKLGFYRAHREQ